jgi:hypothetical protein
MNITYKLSKNFLRDKNYKICIFDVNSLFLFNGKNSIRLMYDFIANLRKNFPNLLVINVVDNGISNILLNKYPYYKANRNHSIKSNNIIINKFGTINSFKAKIGRIHKLDESFSRNLTFYYPGESDFKIGYILKYINKHTSLTKDNILTVSLDKDFLLTTILSDFLLKRRLQKKTHYCLIDADADIKQVKKVFGIEKLNIKNPYDYFYYLILNGDRIDNIKKLFTKGKAINILNNILDDNDNIDLNLLLEYSKKVAPEIGMASISDNAYLVDLFNDSIFSITEKNIMKWILNNFFQNNNINVLL